MNPVGHALIGFALFGPLGAAASVAPDLPIAVAWAVTRGNRRWLLRTHPLLQAQRITHSLVSVVIVACAGALTSWPHAWVLPAAWALHIGIDYLTHPREARWPLL